MSINLNDKDLDNVSGGLTTSYGYPIGPDGSVLFKDKNGHTGSFTALEWKKLCDHYKYTGGNPEAYISDVPYEDLKKALFNM